MIFIMWSITIIVFSIGVLCFQGKALNVIAGFNTMREDEKVRYDKKKLGKIYGCSMIVFAVQLAIIAFFKNDLPRGIGWIIPWGLLGTLLLMIVLANTAGKSGNR